MSDRIESDKKLAQSEAAGAYMRRIAGDCIAKLKLWIEADECDCLMEGGAHQCGLPSLQRLISSAEKALATDHGKAYLEIAKIAEHIFDCGESGDDHQKLGEALAKLPGKGGSHEQNH